MSARFVHWLRTLLFVFIASTGAIPVQAQDPVGTIEVGVRGVTPPFRCSVGWESTEVRTSLMEGEMALVNLPLLGRAASVPFAAVQVQDGNEDVKFDQQSLAWPDPWDSLPYSLRGRSLPPVESSDPQVGPLRWAWLGMSLLLVACLRHRGRLALVAGMLFAATLFFLPATPPRSAPTTTVWEGDADSGRWLEVRGAQDRLDVDGVRPGWLRHFPSKAEGQLVLQQDPSGSHDRTGSWSACFDGARVYFITETRPAIAPGPDGPGAHDFTNTWLRQPGAGWTARGPWKNGQPLPPAIPDAPGPPGWLAANLPQGVGVLLGQWRTLSGEIAWMRLVGFE